MLSSVYRRACKTGLVVLLQKRKEGKGLRKSKSFKVNHFSEIIKPVLRNRLA